MSKHLTSITLGLMGGIVVSIVAFCVGIMAFIVAWLNDKADDKKEVDKKDKNLTP